MNIIFFGNTTLKERLDTRWNNDKFVFFQIDDYKKSKKCEQIYGQINDNENSLIFVPYFLYSWYEKEGNSELNKKIAKLIHSFPGKHVICLFTDLRSADRESVIDAYDGLAKYLDELKDNYIYSNNYEHISICQTSGAWIRDLNAEIYLASKKFMEFKIV